MFIPSEINNQAKKSITSIAVSRSSRQEELKIEFSANGIDYGIIRLTDCHGKIFRMMGINLQQGFNVVTIDNLQTLPAGEYCLYVGDTDGNVLHAEKLQQE